MAETHELGSGIEYPRITIQGREYALKFSRAALYRLDKAGFDLEALPDQLRRWLPQGPDKPGSIRLSVLVDVLHAALAPSPIRCTPEELCEMLDPTLTAEYAVAVIISLSKMRPAQNPTLQPAPANPQLN